MNYVKIYTKTYRDNSARYIELPSLLIEQDGETKVFEQLLKYQIKYSHKSKTWHNKLIQSVSLLFDYMNANPNNYVSAKDFFELFAEAIYSGTIDEEGNDPSGLYWLPKKAQTANTLLSSLSDFSDWLYINYKTEQLNPWREATRYEERLKYMALINRSERSFLGHLDDIHDISETAKTVRNVVTHKNPYAVRNGTKAFPEDKIEKLLREGFKKTRKGYELDLIDGYNWRDTLRLIDKCQKISKSGNDNDSSSTQLVPVGTVQDVGFLLETEADEMHQLQAICNGAELFPETDASKALLKRSQIIDMTLLFNKKQPVMFTLSDEEQLLAGNQFMRLLIKRAGSLKEAIPYAIGRKKLEEIGIHNEFEKELKIMRYDAPLKLLSTNNDA